MLIYFMKGAGKSSEICITFHGTAVFALEVSVVVKKTEAIARGK